MLADLWFSQVTKPETLTQPITGAQSLVIATGPDVDCDPFPNCTCPKGGCPIDVDWHGIVCSMLSLVAWRMISRRMLCLVYRS